MKKFFRSISLFLALVMMTGLVSSCEFYELSRQLDDRTDLTTRDRMTGMMPQISEPDQTINSMEPEPDQDQEPEADNLEKCGYVREDSSSPITEDEARTIMGKAMKIEAWYKTLEIVYIDEVTPESLEKVTAELVASGCTAIVFDIGNLEGVYGHYRPVLAEKYPDIKIWPIVVYD